MAQMRETQRISPRDIMDRVEKVLDRVKTGILATIDGDGKPHMRWMTPVVVKGRPGSIFALCGQDDCKIDQISNIPAVEWMLQTPQLDTVINLKGRVNVIDSPSIKSEILENVGNRMSSFWNVKGDIKDYLVIETVIEEAEYYEPMRGERENVKFLEKFI